MSVLVDQPVTRGGQLVPPQWVLDRFDPLPPPSGGTTDSRRAPSTGPGISFEVVDRKQLSLIGGRLHDAVDLTARNFRSAVFDLYDGIRAELAARDSRHPIRVWSFVPAIHQPMGDGLTRYMVFNSGRHDAFSDWYPDPAEFERSVPTSTGVGHDGPDLVVYCLASDRAGEPRENERQLPAYRYSRTYGPLPPCFARATLARLGDVPTLLIGGTASVRGEVSVHLDDVESQLEETFANLEALVRAQAKRGISDMFLRDARAYYVYPEHSDLLKAAIAARFPELQCLETMQATICREELLVEIEGVAVARSDRRTA